MQSAFMTLLFPLVSKSNANAKYSFHLHSTSYVWKNTWWIRWPMPSKRVLDIFAIQSVEVIPTGSCKYLGSNVVPSADLDGSCRPLLQLIDALLVMGSLEVNDIQQLLRLTDPTAFNYESDTHFDEGLLQMKLDEPVKLQMCYILQHLCDYQLQYRIEGMIAFSEDFVGRLQAVSTASKMGKWRERHLHLGSKTALCCLERIQSTSRADGEENSRIPLSAERSSRRSSTLICSSLLS